MLFKREFVKAQKALWIWIAVLGGLMIMMLSMYPSFAEQQETLDQLLNAYPEAMLQAFNMDQFSLHTVLGFYAIEGYLFTTLFGSIYAVLLASSILVKEESEKTAEFLLSKPLTRTEIVGQKLCAVLLSLIVFNIALSLITYIGFTIAGDEPIESKTFFLITIAPFLLHLTFAAIAFFISSVMKKSRNIISISLGIVLISYFLDIISGISNKFDAIKYFTPFEYVDSASIMIDNTIKPLYLIIMLLIITVSFLGAFTVYRKKDIAS
ncbi:ABC transporter permease subunit [Cytobacillus sp. IB215665]|uniref:ABC transporter permease subunit n=1 Tax=Cytobacillus sp. IB215665 TaxID=3097357 RepID=UPI002A0D6A5E|nr:ABC transporter permease subunit [Cytobacillus sp. IB215665]MDX8366991.1 ABC transporter permease subunit [Cytobacillus sp. IB215665]